MVRLTSRPASRATDVPRAARALGRPRSSASGRSRRTMRPTSSSPARAASWAACRRSRISGGAVSAARLSWSRTAVRVCPTSSCSSCAMRSRSASCAFSVWRALWARSASSRSSIPLKASTTSATSGAPPAEPGARRWPGRSRSTPRASVTSSSRGARLRRTRTTVMPSSSTTPPATTAISVGRVRSLTVTGSTIRASAASTQNGGGGQVDAPEEGHDRHAHTPAGGRQRGAPVIRPSSWRDGGLRDMG